jgi:glycosyltransferase involved in cell wall biosynthesis
MPAYLLTHARVRDELTALFPNESDRIYFVHETRWHRLLWRLGRHLEPRLEHLTTAFALRVLTQLSQRRTARRLIHELGINVVHQPTPVSPREPSFMHSLGAPVIIGPMNGNMSYPPSLKHEEPVVTRVALALGRASSGILNTLFPGKKRASMLLVANERTRRALPATKLAQIRYLPENAVDTDLWKFSGANRGTSAHCRFVYVGRLIPSKGVDLWLRALEQLARRGTLVSATIIGDGPERHSLEEQARTQAILATEMGQVGKVWFAGRRPQSEIAELLPMHDCLVLPTLIESGGAVLLEAMAMGLPVISTNWGGPADYVDDSCGILVPLESRDELVVSLAQAMERIARDSGLREQMGKAGRFKVEQHYTWESKIQQIIGFYRDAISRYFAEGD